MKQLIYSVLYGNSLEAAKVVCAILHKKYGQTLTSVVLTAMIYNKTLGMISASGGAGDDGNEEGGSDEAQQ